MGQCHKTLHRWQLPLPPVPCTNADPDFRCRSAGHKDASTVFGQLMASTFVHEHTSNARKWLVSRVCASTELADREPRSRSRPAPAWPSLSNRWPCEQAGPRPGLQILDDRAKPPCRELLLSLKGKDRGLGKVAQPPLLRHCSVTQTGLGSLPLHASPLPTCPDRAQTTTTVTSREDRGPRPDRGTCPGALTAEGQRSDRPPARTFHPKTPITPSAEDRAQR